MQTVAGTEGAAARARVTRLGRRTGAPATVGAFRSQRLRVDAARLPELASDPAVLNIAPDVAPELHDERSAQIVAGNVSLAFAPSGPGYLAHLTAEGFPSTLMDFVVDITDEGLDTGTVPADGSGHRASRLLHQRQRGAADSHRLHQRPHDRGRDTKRRP